MSKEEQLVELAVAVSSPSREPEYPYEDTQCNLYENLWTINQHVVTSLDVLAKDGGLMAGRITFKNTAAEKNKTVGEYYLEYKSDGTLKAALFQSLQQLADFLNNKSTTIRKREGNEWFFDFAPNGKWENSGAVRIGYYYRPNNGWLYHPNKSEASVHLTIDEYDNRDIELLLVSRTGNKLGYGFFKRDIPVLDPIKYKQHIVLAESLYEVHLASETELQITKIQGKVELGDVWYRFVDK